MHHNVFSELISISECTSALIVQSLLSYSQCDFSNSLYRNGNYLQELLLVPSELLPENDFSSDVNIKDGFSSSDLKTFEFHRLALEFTNDISVLALTVLEMVEGRATSQQKQAAVQHGQAQGQGQGWAQEQAGHPQGQAQGQAHGHAQGQAGHAQGQAQGQAQEQAGHLQDFIHLHDFIQLQDFIQRQA
jgi:hypothetical protein